MQGSNFQIASIHDLILSQDKNVFKLTLLHGMLHLKWYINCLMSILDIRER